LGEVGDEDVEEIAAAGGVAQSHTHVALRLAHAVEGQAARHRLVAEGAVVAVDPEPGRRPGVCGGKVPARRAPRTGRTPPPAPAPAAAPGPTPPSHPRSAPGPLDRVSPDRCCDTG